MLQDLGSFMAMMAVTMASSRTVAGLSPDFFSCKTHTQKKKEIKSHYTSDDTFNHPESYSYLGIGY